MKKILIPLSIFIFLILPILPVKAIGLVVQPLEAYNILRGQEIEDKLSLYNSKDSAITFYLNSEGDIYNWVTYYNGNNEEINSIEIPANKIGNVKLIIKIPEDQPNGEYVGNLSALYKVGSENNENKDTNQENSSAGVQQKFLRPVKINITDEEIILLEIMTNPENYVVKKGDPLNIRIVYNNKGNISLKPQTQIKIIDLNSNQEIHNAIYPYPENEEPVKALKEKKITIPFYTNDLKKQDYKAFITVLVRGEKYFKDDFIFSVNSKGLVLGISDIKINWWIIGGALLIILITLSILLSKKFRINNSL